MRWVLLPGFDGTGVLYEPLLRALPPEIEPVVVRYPPDQICSASSLVDIVLSSVPEREPYVLIAESFSGPIALRASSLRAPTALVLCASFVKCPLPPVAIAPLKVLGRILSRWRPPKWCVRRYLLGEAPDDVVALFYSALAAVSRRVLAHRFAVLLELNEERTLAKLNCPLLYLQATRDRLVGTRNALLLQAHYPAARIERIEAPHLVLQAQPQAALRAILRFLSQSFGARSGWN